VRLFCMRSTAPRCTPATSHSYVHGMSDIAGLYGPREGLSSHICTRPSPRPRLSAPPFYSTRPVIVLTALSASLRPCHIFSRSRLFCVTVFTAPEIDTKGSAPGPRPCGGLSPAGGLSAHVPLRGPACPRPLFIRHDPHCAHCPECQP